MGSTGLQLTAAILCFCGTLLAVFATVNNSWGKSDVSGEVLENVQRSWGLWMRCQHLSAGLNTCDHYDRLILGAPTELTLSRAFMVLGMLLGTLSTLLMLVGSDCSTLLSEARKKKKVRCVSGILGISAGALVMVTGILIAIIIVKEYHQASYFVTVNNGGGLGRRAADDDLRPLNADDVDLGQFQQANCDSDGNCEAVKTKGERFGASSRSSTGQKMVFGGGVMLAWGSGLILLIAGGLMLSQGCGGSTYEEEHDGYNAGTYPPQNKNRNNEYL